MQSAPAPQNTINGCATQDDNAPGTRLLLKTYRTESGNAHMRRDVTLNRLMTSLSAMPGCGGADSDGALEMFRYRLGLDAVKAHSSLEQEMETSKVSLCSNQGCFKIGGAVFGSDYSLLAAG